MSNAEKIYITAETVDPQSSHYACSYLRAYFEAKNLTVGDYWIAHEYQAWITNKHYQFRLTKNHPFAMGYNKPTQKEFEDYITDVEEVMPE